MQTRPNRVKWLLDNRPTRAPRFREDDIVRTPSGQLGTVRVCIAGYLQVDTEDEPGHIIPTSGKYVRDEYGVYTVFIGNLCQFIHETELVLA